MSQPETSLTAAHTPQSPWAPLRVAAFRNLWLALLASNIGTWMQAVGAQWLPAPGGPGVPVRGRGDPGRPHRDRADAARAAAGAGVRARCGLALTIPAWQALIPELVRRGDLPSASALAASSMNVARSVGPAIAGVLIAGAGVGTVFASTRSRS